MFTLIYRVWISVVQSEVFFICTLYRADNNKMRSDVVVYRERWVWNCGECLLIRRRCWPSTSKLRYQRSGRQRRVVDCWSAFSLARSSAGFRVTNTHSRHDTCSAQLVLTRPTTAASTTTAELLNLMIDQTEPERQQILIIDAYSNTNGELQTVRWCWLFYCSANCAPQKLIFNSNP